MLTRLILLLSILSIIMPYTRAQHHLEWQYIHFDSSYSRLGFLDATIDGSNFYIFASFQEDDLYPLFLKLDENGNKIWDKSYKQKVTGDKIVFDNSGNFYVPVSIPLGYSSWPYMHLMKCNSNGDSIWIKTLLSEFGGYSNKIITDLDGNIIVTGGNQYECATIKCTVDGEILWVNTFKTGLYQWNDMGFAVDHEGIGLANDNYNNIFVVSRAGLLKYDPHGILRWSNILPIRCYSSNIQINSKNEIFLDCWNELYKFSQNGEFIWYRDKHNSIIGPSILDRLDNLYVAGYLSEQSIPYDYDYVLQNIIEQWVTKWTYIYLNDSLSMFPVSITTDRFDNIYILGKASEELWWLHIYNRFGNLKEQIYYHNIIPAIVNPTKVNVDPTLNIFLTGTIFYCDNDSSGLLILKYKPELGCEILKEDVSIAGGSDGLAIVVPYGGSRPYTYLWNDDMHTTDSIVTDLYENRYYSVVVTDAENNKIIDSVYISVSAVENISGYNNILTVYPNPASGFINLNNINELNSELVLFTSDGREVFRDYLINTFYQLDLTNVPPGIYILKIKSGNYNYVKRIIKY